MYRQKLINRKRLIDQSHKQDTGESSMVLIQFSQLRVWVLFALSFLRRPESFFWTLLRKDTQNLGVNGRDARRGAPSLPRRHPAGTHPTQPTPCQVSRARRRLPVPTSTTKTLTPHSLPKNKNKNLKEVPSHL